MIQHGDMTDKPYFCHLRRLLVRHSRVMERLREEVRTVVGDEEHPSREQIRKMKYLAMIIKESRHFNLAIVLKLAYSLEVSAFTHQSR